MSNTLDPDLSALIRVQTVSECYKQTTLVGKELNNNKGLYQYCDESVGLEKYLNKQDCLQKSLKIKLALKRT